MGGNISLMRKHTHKTITPTSRDIRPLSAAATAMNTKHAPYSNEIGLRPAFAVFVIKGGQILNTHPETTG